MVFELVGGGPLDGEMTPESFVGEDCGLECGFRDLPQYAAVEHADETVDVYECELHQRGPHYAYRGRMTVGDFAGMKGE